MDSNQFRQAAHAALDEIINYYDTLPSRRVLPNVEPGYLRPMLPSGPPEDGEQWSAIQADIESKIMPGLTHWQSPNFFAWFPANSSYPAMLGELYSAAFTGPAFNWICSPAVTELETIVLDWLAKLLNLPDGYMSHGEGGGVIQGSASEAVVTAQVAARERFLRMKTAGLEGEAKDNEIDRLKSKMVTLGSDQAHSSTQKGAMILGLKYRTVPTRLEDDLSMTGDSVRSVIEKCKSEGLEPFYLTVTLGTTSTCAVDRFEEIAELTKDYPEIWIHVDAAYAGAALICEEYQHLTKAFDAFHSFEMNMHKWLLTNFDAGCMFVKRRRDLIDALSITPSYLLNQYSESGFVTDYRDWQISLGRRFRSLKIWFVMRTYGINGMKQHVRRHIKMSEIFHSLVRSREDLFSVLVPPAFALTAITVKPRKAIEEGNRDSALTCAATGIEPNGYTPDAKEGYLAEANKITKEVCELVNERGEIFLTGTVTAGTYVMRVVSASPQSEEQYIRRAFQAIADATEKILNVQKEV